MTVLLLSFSVGMYHPKMHYILGISLVCTCKGTILHTHMCPCLALYGKQKYSSNISNRIGYGSRWSDRITPRSRTVFQIFSALATLPSPLIDRYCLDQIRPKVKTKPRTAGKLQYCWKITAPVWKLIAWARGSQDHSYAPFFDLSAVRHIVDSFKPLKCTYRKDSHF